MNYRFRLFSIVIPLCAGVLYMLGHTIHFALSQNSREQVNLMLMNRTPRSFEELRIQTERLNAITSNIEKYSLGEIRQELQRTSGLVTISRKEFAAQYDAWLEVKEAAGQDRESFLELRAQLDDVSRLQDNQIQRLRKLLDESAEPSFFDSVLGLVGSFFLGVMSSVLASAAYERVMARRAIGSPPPRPQSMASKSRSTGQQKAQEQDAGDCKKDSSKKHSKKHRTAIIRRSRQT